MRARSSAMLLVLALAFTPAAGYAADPQPYNVKIADTGNGDLDTALSASSLLETLRKKSPVSPFALVTRAREDGPRLTTALNAFGYFAGSVRITIEGHDASDPDLPELLDKLPPDKKADVRVAVALGPLYHLQTIALQGNVPDDARHALTLKSGDPAVSADLVGAEAAMLTALEEDGYAFAKVSAPDAIADDTKHTLDVTYTIDPGPRATVGPISVKGLKDVNEDTVRRTIKIREGDLYRPSKIEETRQSLVDLGAFSGVSVRAADHPGPGNTVPLEFDFTERERHTVTLNGLYSTDLGLSLGATWSHHNLLGGAEQLNLSASATQIGGTATGGVGYAVNAQFIRPVFLEPDQQLELDISAIKASLDAYDQTAETLGGLVRRKFSKLWKGSIGLSGTEDDVTQEHVRTLYQLVRIPFEVDYDSTGITDITSDPFKGARVSFAVTPTGAFGAHTLGFVVLQASASTYFDLSTKGRSVIALRALVGSIQGGRNFDLPPDQRLYAGGSATVRGFAYQSIGPLFPDGKPIGASSVDAASIEFRQRFGEDWGAAAFVDAGQASAQSAPFTGTLRVGAGIGPRYYTPIGAIRLDFAVPLTPVPHGDTFEIYIGIGQAF